MHRPRLRYDPALHVETGAAQVAEPGSETVAPLQGAQLPAQALLYVFAAQRVHEEELDVAANVPAGHWKHEVLPASEDSPALHVFCTRRLFDHEPGDARRHIVWPVAGW